MKFEKIISYTLHPVLFSTISTLFYFILTPKYLPKNFEYKVLTVVFISTYIIPILFLFILKKRNRIEDFHLKTIKERKLPIFFFAAITSLLAFRLLEIKIMNLLSLSFFGASLALFLVFVLFHFKVKTSLHTLAIGGLTGFVILISYHFKIQILIIISTLFIVFGLIAYSRLKLKAHSNLEIYLGFILGVTTQFIVYYLIPITLKLLQNIPN